MSVFSKNIRYLRKSKGWSQDYVASILRYRSYTTIQKWESGMSEPPLKKLKEVSDLFGVDIDVITNYDLEMQRLPVNDDILPLSDIERQIIERYRTADTIFKEIVCRALSISMNDL